MSSRAIHLSGRGTIAAFRTAGSGPAPEFGAKPGAASRSTELRRGGCCLKLPKEPLDAASKMR